MKLDSAEPCAFGHCLHAMVHKKQSGFNQKLLPSYLEEFMWRQEFGDHLFKNSCLTN